MRARRGQRWGSLELRQDPLLRGGDFNQSRTEVKEEAMREAGVCAFMYLLPISTTVAEDT